MTNQSQQRREVGKSTHMLQEVHSLSSDPNMIADKLPSAEGHSSSNQLILPLSVSYPTCPVTLGVCKLFVRPIFVTHKGIVGQHFSVRRIDHSAPLFKSLGALSSGTCLFSEFCECPFRGGQIKGNYFVYSPRLKSYIP